MTTSTNFRADPSAAGISRAPNNSPQSEPAFEMDIRSLLVSLRRGKWILLAAIIIGLAAGLAVTLLTVPTYVASSSVKIEEDVSQIVTVGSDRPAGGDYMRFAQTQIDLLESRETAGAVLDQEGLLANPVFLETAKLPAGRLSGQAEQNRRSAAIEFLRKSLKVELPRDTRVALVSISSSNPGLAARIANGYARAAVTQDLRRKYDSSSYARSFLTQQLETTRRRLEASELALNNYARQTGIVNIGAEGTSQTVTTAGLQEAGASVSRATEQRIAAEQAWRSASQGPPLSIPQVLGNPGVQGLMQQRAQISAKLNQDLKTLGVEHPSVVGARANLAAIDGEIRKFASSVVTSLRQQYEAAKSQEESLSGRVNSLVDSALTENKLQVQYNILKREVDTNRALYDGLLQRLKEISASAGVNNSNVTVVDRAPVPHSPSAPSLLLNLGVAGVGALFLGLLFVFVREQLDQRLRTPDEAAAESRLPVLGIVPKLPPETSMIEQLALPKSAVSESYFSARASLALSTPEGLPRTLLVTSNAPSEGKTTSAYALALSIARIGRRTLLVDADLRRPRLHSMLGKPNTSGLSDYLAGKSNVPPTQQATDIPNLALVSSGPLPPSPTELLAGPNLARFLDWAVQEYDCVIIDGPPVLGIADAPLISSVVDGTLFVAEMARITRFTLRNALNRLYSAKAQVVGLLLTKHVSSAGDDYHYQYYYQYGDVREVA